MNTQDFKIWLIKNGYTQDSLAKKLGINKRTITVYNNNGRYPVIFQYALKGLECGK